MKRSSIVFLQIVIVLIGVAALAFLLWEPQVEGVNKNRTNFEIYFQDPFLALCTRAPFRSSWLSIRRFGRWRTSDEIKFSRRKS